jgi:hypothetical protein
MAKAWARMRACVFAVRSAASPEGFPKVGA